MSWDPPAIASIVEGKGEIPALPKLLHRIAGEVGIPFLLTPPPWRVNRGTLVRAGEIERAVNSVADRGGSTKAVLVIFDADDDCPAELAPKLLTRARQARKDARVAVVLPKSEFEAWFLAAASSLGGHRGFPVTLNPPSDPEAIRGAKEWLTRTRTRIGGRPYEPIVDQTPLASVFDLAQARANSPSFSKFCRDVAWLLGVAPAS